MSYRQTARAIYNRATPKPKAGIHGTTSPVRTFPGLNIPKAMPEINGGSGRSVSAQDPANSPTVPCAGLGEGIEFLQFACPNRRLTGLTALYDKAASALSLSGTGIPVSEGLWHRKGRGGTKVLRCNLQLFNTTVY